MNNSSAIQEKISVTGVNWKKTPFDPIAANNLANSFKISRIVAQIIASREIPFHEVENFLNPKLKSALPNPFEFLDMDKAVAKTIEAIQNKKKIIIFGDYDVDGACSSALLKRFFAKFNLNATIYIPDRLTEGYGPNVKAIEKFAQQNIDLCIFVDCGSVAYEPLARAAQLGIDTIIIDHHVSEENIPQTCALVNPNRLDETSLHGNLCAAGVTLFFAYAVKIRLTEIDFFIKNEIPTIQMNEFLDLVALATVCDIVSLKGLNRVLVHYGLQTISQRKNLGLRTLVDTIGIDSKIDTYHLGFLIGPRINAGGRVASSDLGALLLSTEDENLAQDIAKKLDFYNNERREIEATVLQEAIQKVVDQNIVENRHLIMVAGAWHPGVIGIVASRLKDKFNLPTIVIGIQNDTGKASARGVPTIDFGSTVLNARAKNLLIEGGGHKMAAGFSMEMSKFEEVYDFFDQSFKKGVQEHLQNTNRFYSSEIAAENLNLNFSNQINKIAPFGVGNYEPIFKLQHVRIIMPRIIGEKHISFMITTSNGEKAKKAICFNACDNSLGTAIMNSRSNVDLIGKININFWKGTNFVQFVVQDLID